MVMWRGLKSMQEYSRAKVCGPNIFKSVKGKLIMCSTYVVV